MLNILNYNLKVIYFETWFFLVFGALVGSFLNVCILRIPEKTFFKNLRSVCPNCQKKIPFWLNIPVFSYLFLRGRAACCKARLSIQYPLVEVFTMLMFPLVYWHFPFVLDTKSGQLDPEVFLRFCHFIIFVCLMITVSVIDIRLQIIPDVLSLSMIALSPLWVYLHPELKWQSSLLGVVFGGGVLYVVAWTYYLIRRDYGLGFGDVKLLAGIGGWLGAEAILPTLFLGSILGSFFGVCFIIFTKGADMKMKIPFGPFLALGAVCHMLFGQQISDILYFGNFE